MVRILIADDHQLLIDGIKSTLANVEDIIIVAEANNGYQVLEKLGSGMEVDVILMDINMPKMDGLNCTRLVLKDFPGIRIIALSQFDEKRFVKRMVKNGASGYLLKDVGKEEIVLAIRTVYHGGNYYFDQDSEVSVSKETREENGISLFPKLTEREIEILTLIGKGLSTYDISNQLFISVNTVESHRAHLINKAKVKNTAELIRWAALNDLLD